MLSSSASTFAPSSQLVVEDPRNSMTCTLPDGRKLAFTEGGSPTGHPVFFFHGFTSSRKGGAFLHDVSLKLNVRAITPDRPGVGLSTFQPKRSVLDWPSDISALANHLNIKQYSVIGNSGGCAYALACAKASPKDELKAVGIMTGLGPIEDWMNGLPWAFRWLMWSMTTWPSFWQSILDSYVVEAVRHPNPMVFEKLWDINIKCFMTEKDRKLFADPRQKARIIASSRESWRQGTLGWKVEAELVGRPWGFQLEDVEFEGVKLWYGTSDLQTPVVMGKIIADRLKGAILKEFEGETHYTVGLNIEQILKELLNIK